MELLSDGDSRHDSGQIIDVFPCSCPLLVMRIAYPQCWCSNLANYDQHGESTGCTMPCEGDATQVCGGVYAMNVYQIGTRRRLVEAPIPSVTYIGCYEDSQERVVSKRSFHRTMTNEVGLACHTCHTAQYSIAQYLVLFLCRDCWW